MHKKQLRILEGSYDDVIRIEPKIEIEKKPFTLDNEKSKIVCHFYQGNRVQLKYTRKSIWNRQVNGIQTRKQRKWK